MTSTIRQRLILALLPVTLLLTGCSLTDPFGTNQAAPPVSPVGVYKSSDRGTTWTTKNSVLAPGQSTTLDETNVVSFLMDPTDRETLYLGSEERGLYSTNNSAESWAPSRGIRSQTILSIAVPSLSSRRCTLFISAANVILRTHDCGRFWEQVHIDPRKDVRITSLAVHITNPDIIYAGTNKGEILRSLNNGTSWDALVRFNDEIKEIVPHTLNPDILYVALSRGGFRLTENGGTEWTDVSQGLQEFKQGGEIFDVTLDPLRPETIILATRFGILRSTDNGKTWNAIPLLTLVGQVTINSVAVNPKDPKEIYYTTDTILHHSTDAGETWETKNLPFTAAKSKILIDPERPETLYLGVSRAAARR